MSATLRDRIATALSGKPSAAALAKLIDEVGNAVADAANEKAEAEAIAIDPLADSKAVDAAHKSLDAIGLNVRRLDNAVAALREKHAAAVKREADAAQLARYQEIEAERDSICELIRTEYAEAVPKLVALAERIVANNAAIDAMKVQPAGKRPIVRAETLARGKDEGGGWHPTIARNLRLPKVIDDGLLAYPKGMSQ